MIEPKYPDVHVQLTGRDGNAFSVIGAVESALRKEAGTEASRLWLEDAFAATSYEHLLQLAQETVAVS